MPILRLEEARGLTKDLVQQLLEEVNSLAKERRKEVSLRTVCTYFCARAYTRVYYVASMHISYRAYDDSRTHAETKIWSKKLFKKKDKRPINFCLNANANVRIFHLFF